MIPKREDTSSQRKLSLQSTMTRTTSCVFSLPLCAVIELVHCSFDIRHKFCELFPPVHTHMHTHRQSKGRIVCVTHEMRASIDVCQECLCERKHVCVTRAVTEKWNATSTTHELCVHDHDRTVQWRARCLCVQVETCRSLLCCRILVCSREPCRCSSSRGRVVGLSCSSP